MMLQHLHSAGQVLGTVGGSSASQMISNEAVVLLQW